MSRNSPTRVSRSLSSSSKESWVVVAVLFSLILGGVETPIFGRKPIVSPFDVLFTGVLFVFFCRSILGSFKFNFSDKTTLYLSLAFIFIQAISFLTNLREVPRAFLAMKISAFGYLSYVLCISAVKWTRDVQRIVVGLITWGAILSILLMYYYLSDWSSMIGLEGSSETKSEIGIAIGRSNYLAALLVPILPLAIAGIFASRRSIRFGASVFAVTILAGLLITMSKGAFCSLLVGTLCATPVLRKAGVNFRHAIGVLTAVIGILLLVFLAAPDLLLLNYDLFSSRLGNPDFARLDLWKVAWDLFVSHPLLGIGPNAIYLYNKQFAIDDLYTHNFILNTLSELGLMGGVLFFVLLGVLIRRSYRLCLASLADPQVKPIALGLFVGLLCTLAHGLVEPTFPGQQYAVIFWVCAALVSLHQRMLPSGAAETFAHSVLRYGRPTRSTLLES